MSCSIMNYCWILQFNWYNHNDSLLPLLELIRFDLILDAVCSAFTILPVRGIALLPNYKFRYISVLLLKILWLYIFPFQFKLNSSAGEKKKWKEYSVSLFIVFTSDTPLLFWLKFTVNHGSFVLLVHFVLHISYIFFVVVFHTFFITANKQFDK